MSYFDAKLLVSMVGGLVTKSSEFLDGFHGDDIIVMDGDGFASGGQTRIFRQGLLHCEHSPAWRASAIDGGKLEVWCRRGVPHREEGPAVLHPSGDVEFWLFGVRVPGWLFSIYLKLKWLTDAWREAGERASTVRVDDNVQQ